MNVPQNACFSFILSKEEIDSNPTKHLKIAEYTFSYDENTPIQTSSAEGREIILFGLAVNVRNGISEHLTDILLKGSRSVENVIQLESWLGGKYLIIYADATGCYLIPDATASIPILYTISSNDFVCSSYEMPIVNHLHIAPNPKLQKIRDSGEISQAMPYDVTCYREIKVLLPNHVLDCRKQSAKRFVNAAVRQPEITAEKAAEITAPYIERIAAYYAAQYKLYCPITGGRDSRVVLAYLDRECHHAGKDLLCYTMRHSYHHGNEDDLVIPEQLAKVGHFRYEQTADEPETSCAYDELDNLLGQGRYAKRTAVLADTIYKHYGDGAIVNGDIIGQVGKCSLHRDIPEALATAAYFRCKVHNYAKETKAYLKDWIQDIHSTDEHVNLFDLFSIESRMGRWAAQENTIYNIRGQRYLNIFNSRSIVYTWTNIPRKQRKTAALQKALIRRVKPELLDVPFETDHGLLIKISKANGFFYYIGSRIKHVIGYVKFKAEHKKE